MPYDPWKHRPKTNPAQTRYFTICGEELTLTFRKMSQVQACAAYEVTQTLIERYLTGNEQDGTPPMEFPPVGNVSVPINKIVIDTAVSMAGMQPDDSNPRYSAEDFIAMQISMDEVEWNAVRGFAAEINTAEKPTDEKAPTVPNASGAATKESSEPPSSTPDNILRLPHEQTPFSSQSTGDWQENPAKTFCR